MKRIPRYYDSIFDFLRKDKVLILYGPRQVGKTNLVQNAIKSSGKKVKYDTGDDYRSEELWNSRDLTKLKDYIAGYDTVIIDEAQRIQGIGTGLKMLVDAGVPAQFIVTGSSSFELSGQLGEPLTGRKHSLFLFPVAQMESISEKNRFELKQDLETFLIYGSYPEVLTAASTHEKREILDEITGSYLLKDIFELERIKSSKLIFDLLRLLAFQIGNPVSLNELGNSLGINYKTVARYLDIMEKAFILYNVSGYSGNLRKEISKKSKYYFYDNGIRNAIIANYNPPNLRNDTGALWENFIFMERTKMASYTNIYRNVYFWRTWNGKEIDIVEEREGRLFGYECKYGQKKPAAPREWTETYPDAEFSVINPESYTDFVLP